METKTESLTIRVDKYLSKQFKEIAKENESSASQLLRKYMKEYVQKHRQAQIKL